MCKGFNQVTLTLRSIPKSKRLMEAISARIFN